MAPKLPGGWPADRVRPWVSAAYQFVEVALVVLRGCALHVFEHFVNLASVSAAHVIELHSDSRAGIQPDYRAFSLDLSFIDREHHLQLRGGRQYGTGFNIATTQAEIGDAAHHQRLLPRLLQFDGDPAFHSGVQAP